MTKNRTINLRVSGELYRAIHEVSEAKNLSKSTLILPILRDVFLPDEDQVIVIKRSGSMTRPRSMADTPEPILKSVCKFCGEEFIPFSVCGCGGGE